MILDIVEIETDEACGYEHFHVGREPTCCSPQSSKKHSCLIGASAAHNIAQTSIKRSECTRCKEVAGETSVYA